MFNTNLIPWPRKWQFFEGNPPLLIQLMLKLISTLRLSPVAFEVNNSFVLPFKWSRLEHAPRSEGPCQAFQRARCISVPRDCILLQTKEEVSAGGGRKAWKPLAVRPGRCWKMECICFQSTSRVSDGRSFVKGELLLCSHFEAYSICSEMCFCPPWVYLLPELLCMCLKCHSDHPFLVWFIGVKTAINWQPGYFSYMGCSVRSQVLRYVCLLSCGNHGADYRLLKGGFLHLNLARNWSTDDEHFSWWESYCFPAPLLLVTSRGISRRCSHLRRVFFFFFFLTAQESKAVGPQLIKA